jgi:hypothetical protein
MQMLKKQKLDPSVQTEKKSIIYWLLISFVVVFLFWSPFQRALFNGNSYDFERPLYSSFVWSSIIMLFMSIFFLFVWKWTTQRDALSIFVWLIPITYVISLIPAASQNSAANMVNIQIMYAVFFILGSYLTKNKLGNDIITSTLFSSGYFIVIFGLFNWLGNGKFAGSVVSWFVELVNEVYRDAVMTDSSGLRLTSVFQYANSYAAFLIALLFGSLFFVVKSRKITMVAVHAFMLVPILISFFLTLSRGAMVVIPIIVLIILFFLSITRQILFLIHMVIGFAASFMILQKITNAGTQLHQQYVASVSLNNWLLLIAVSIAVAIISVLVQKFVTPILEAKLERFSGKKLTVFIVPAAAIVIGAIGLLLLFSNTGFTNLLPENVKNRIQNINFAQNSVLERGTFYKDGIKVFKDYPLFGAGGGAWSALFEKYQNNPYVSRQAHNFFVQYLVEVGIIGLLIFLVFLGLVLYLFIRSYIRNNNESRDSHLLYFILSISLLIHSIIDFDLSFAYLGVLLFLCLGAMVAIAGNAPFKWNMDRIWINKLYPSLLLILSLVLFFISVRLLSADSSFATFKQVIGKNNNYNEIITPLNEAIKLHPAHPNYVAEKIAILLQIYNQDKSKNEVFYTEAQNLLAETRQKEPFNRQLLQQQIDGFKLKNQVEQASKLADDQLVNFPWDISMYEESITLHKDLGNKAHDEKNNEVREKHWNEALQSYSKVLEQIKFLGTLPKEQQQGRPFNVTNKIAFSISQINYVRGDYAAASNLLKPFVTDQLDNELNRTIARWYYASTSKQKLPDSALYDKLIAADAKEKQQIETLLNMPVVK